VPASLRASSGQVDHTYRVLRDIEQVFSSLKDAETGQDHW
jgi:CHASE3 domain sensor protein